MLEVTRIPQGSLGTEVLVLQRGWLAWKGLWPPRYPETARARDVGTWCDLVCFGDMMETVCVSRVWDSSACLRIIVPECLRDLVCFVYFRVRNGDSASD